MTNAWSLLYDEMTEHSKHYYDYDRNNLDRENPFTMNEYPYPEIEVSQKTTVHYGLDEHPYPDYTELTLNQPIDRISPFVNDNITMTENNRYKYSEDEILKELTDYIVRTYDQHYSAGDDKIQTLDLIEACGDGEAFCRSNILKYASRYDKKGTARRDIMKILHYAVLLMHFNDKNAQRETYNQ